MAERRNPLPPPKMPWSTPTTHALFLGFAYHGVGLAMMYLAWRARAGADPDARRNGAFFFWAGVLLLMMGVERQLGIMPAITALMRGSARSEGWYATWRRPVQATAIVLTLLVGAIAIVTSFAWLGAGWMRAGASIVGLVFLICLMLIRATSMHEVDRFLYRAHTRLFNLPANSILEVSGLALVALGMLPALNHRVLPPGHNSAHHIAPD